MKSNIYNTIKERSNKITFKELKKKFDIDTITLENILLELKLEGKILQESNKYSLFPEDLYIGEVTTTLSGNKIIFYNDTRIPIASNFFNSILPNDIVSFRLNERNEAQIYTIIDRRISNITCEVINDNGTKKLLPYHNNIAVSIESKKLKDYLDGDIVLVDLKTNDDGDYCMADIVKRIGHRSDPNIEEISIAINYGFDNNYDDEYLEELKQIPTDTNNEDLSQRRDFRHLKTFTIDGKYTKDMDDGLSVETLPNGNTRVYVHISDVSRYIKPNSKIFERACEKTTSLYLNNSVFHMIHHVISNGICSLNPNVDRLTKTVIMDIDQDGNIYNTEIVKSIINSNKKMTYDEVDLILNKEEIPEGYEDYVEELNLLSKVSLLLKNKSVNQGALEFDNNELEKEYDSDNNLRKHTEMGESLARDLIEYLMIGANSEVANFLLYIGLPGVFRIHECPNIRSVNEAIKIINETSKKKIKPVKDVSDPSVLQPIINSLREDENFKLLSSILLRFMKRARYTTNNAGHYALALYAYCHFTSPIRRLADLLIHHILDIVLERPELIANINYQEVESQLENLCKRASYMERQADNAELEAEKTAILKEMEKYPQTTYEASILDIGSKIKLRVNNVDVYVKKESLSNNFTFINDKHKFYDNSTDKYLRVGSKVLVEINKINSFNRSIHLTILNIIEPKTKTKTL